jgi:hypothetical protein
MTRALTTAWALVCQRQATRRPTEFAATVIPVSQPGRRFRSRINELGRAVSWRETSVPVRRAEYGGPVTALTELDALKIPAGLRPVAEEIVSITDSVCLALLDEGYADLARRAVAKLSRKRPSPLPSGRRSTWAAGVVYAVGQVNFLADPASEPCVTADQLSAAFGVAKPTMGTKAKQVRDALGISHFSPEFQLASVAAENPALWFIQVDGLVMDARSLPLDIQAEAYQLGFIPYIPALGPEGTPARHDRGR